MGEIEQDGVLENRLLMALIGALAGFSLWFLVDALPDIIDNSRIVMALAALTGGFFAVLLAVLGPLRLMKAVPVAALLAILSAGLFAWASYRYENVDDFLGTGFVFATFLVLVWLPTPFAIAALTPGEGWRDYPALFSHAWQIFVRYLVAWVFTALFWGIILLSDQVLRIVGLEIIQTLLDIDPVPFVLTGLSLGLGLAVVYELRTYVSPYLALRLLRLLLPPVLVVSVVFLIAAPIQGLSNLFGGLSAAGILMALALIAATLITTALDACDDEAATSRILVGSARAMALVLPILGALAAWAVWQRVAQYGLTPTRLAAMISVLVVLAYGVTYGVAVLRGAAWQDHIRRANVTMALVMIALSALWLSPVLNPERMSANSQLARFENGKTAVDDLDLWQLDREWGRAGQAAMARLRGIDHPDRAALDARIALLEESRNMWQWQGNDTRASRQTIVDALLPVLAVRPIGAQLPENAFGEARDVGLWLSGCKIDTPAGNPGCVALVADFNPDLAGPEVVVFHLTSPTNLRHEYWDSDHSSIRQATLGPIWNAPEIIDKILGGQVKINAVTQATLLIGEFQITLEE